VDHKRSRYVVLRRKRVRGTKHDLGTTRLQGVHQVCRFRRDVETGRDAHTAQWLLTLETLADCAEDGHFVFRPFDAVASASRQLKIFYIVFNRHDFSCMDGVMYPET